MSEASRTTDSVKVSLTILREIKIDYHVDRLDVNTPGEQIRGHQMSSSAITKLVKDAVSVCLLHLGMYVVARVAKFRNFLRQQFNTIHRVAKDNTLVDFKFGEKCVEAVHFLSLFDVGIELRDTTQREFVHEIDTVRVGDEVFAKVSHGNWEGCAEQADLVVLITEADNLFQNRLELG
mmetsp:Transcript_25940/g.55518  ORF Transcript_25940/g.55518 Transcript_25940/m.55518 type:complete len:178 (+) Transcript_25940:1998-2531(+)